MVFRKGNNRQSDKIIPYFGKMMKKVARKLVGKKSPQLASVCFLDNSLDEHHRNVRVSDLVSYISIVEVGTLKN